MVSVESLVNFVIAHNEGLIEWLVITIVLLGGLLVLRSVFFKPTGGQASPDQLSQLEEALKKVVGSLPSGPGVAGSRSAREQTGAAGAESVASDSPSETNVSGDQEASGLEISAETFGTEVGDPQVAQLKQKLQVQEQEITQLREAKAASGESAVSPSGDSEALKNKVRELEGKLAEYEIIEEDIADLSAYKAENVKLKEELEVLRSGEGPASPTEELAVDAAPSEPEVAAEESPSEPEPEQAAAPEPEAVSEPEPVLEAEFEEPAEEVAVAPSSEEVVEEVSEPPQEAVSAAPIEGDDILAEFTAMAQADEVDDLPSDVAAQVQKEVQQTIEPEASADDSSGESEESSEEGLIDTDKMVAELANLEEPAVEDDGSVLEEEMDVDKMAAEATQLASSDGQ